MHSAMVYVIQVYRQLSSRTRMVLLERCPKCKLYETCRFSRQNKFVKSVHLVGFIIKKFVMMHGHTNVIYIYIYIYIYITYMPIHELYTGKYM